MIATLALSSDEMALMHGVFRAHPEIRAVKLFGSRAKGTQKVYSDVDLALVGDVDALGAEAISSELDELPMPYRFHVQALAAVTFEGLLGYIERVGTVIYESAVASSNSDLVRAR